MVKKMKYISRMICLRTKIFVLIMKAYVRSPGFAKLLWCSYKMKLEMMKFAMKYRPPEVAGDALDRLAELYGISRGDRSDNELRRSIAYAIDAKNGGADNE